MTIEATELKAKRVKKEPVIVKNITVMPQQQLKKMLKVIGEKSNILPCLDNVMFKDGFLLHTDMETEIKIKTIVEGNFLVNKKDLSNVLNFFNDVSINGYGNKVICSDGCEAISLQKGDNGNYPKMQVDNLDYEHKGVITLADIEKLIVAEYFTGHDELRPVMQGVYFGMEHVCATDAIMLYHDTTDKQLTIDFIIPRKIIHLLKILKTEVDVFQNKDGNRVILQAKDLMEICFRPIEGRYPNWKAVLPQEQPTTITVQKSRILALVDRSSKFTNHITKRSEISFGEKLIVTSSDLDFETGYCGEIAEYQKEGDDVKLGFNSFLLKDIIKKTKGDTVTFKIAAPNKGVILNENFLIMPVNINKY